MRCISAVRVKGGQFVPCGKCNFCMANRRADWSYRLQQELVVSSSAYFITLTYMDEKYPVDGVQIRDMQLFIKRLRKYESKLEKSATPAFVKWRLRYYAVGEYGTRTGRGHYHVIVFNLSAETLVRINEIWTQGMVKVGPCGPGAIPYITKYHVNRQMQVPPGCKPSFCLMSRGTGIGANYVAKYRDWHREGKRFFAMENGVMRRLPRYYRDKMFGVHDKAVHAMKMDLLVLKEYWRHVDALRSAYPNPEERVEAEIRHAYNSVVKKANEFNLF